MTLMLLFPNHRGKPPTPSQGPSNIGLQVRHKLLIPPLENKQKSYKTNAKTTTPVSRVSKTSKLMFNKTIQPMQYAHVT